MAEKAPIFLMSMTKPVEDPLDVFLAFFFFFISSRIDKTVPTIFPTALSGGITAVRRVSLFICYKHDFTFYTERM